MDNNTLQNIYPVNNPATSPTMPTNQPTPNVDPTPKKNKKPLIIVSIIIVLLLISTGFGVALVLMSKTPKSETPQVVDTNFENMSKEQALAFAKEHYGKKYVPEGLIDDEIRLNNGLNDYTLLYSYRNEADILKMAEESVMNIDESDNRPLEQRFSINKVSDLYSTVTKTDNSAKGAGSVRYLGICLNKEIADYREEESVYDDGTISIDSYLTIKKLNRDTAEKVLKIYAITEVYGRMIHSYEFQDLDDEYRLRINFVGIGLTSFNVEDANHTVTTYYMAWSVDKKTGELNAVRVSETDGSRNFVINTYELNNEEYLELAEAMAIEDAEE